MTLMSPLSSSPSKPVLPCPRKRAQLRLLAIGLSAICLVGGVAIADGLCPGEWSHATKMQQRIVQEWPLRSHGDEATQFVQALGVNLAQHHPNGRGVPWRFSVVRNLGPNAFSVGGGYVFVTEGAITFSKNEAELAAILAHELGHELAGHFCNFETARSGGLFDIFSSSPVPEYQDSTGVGSVRQTIDPQKELEADRYAVSILQATGYDPRAMLDVARRLPRGGDAHFLDQRRVSSLERLLSGLPVGLAPRDSDQFKDIKRTLIGEAPR
jgi:predicted Zn-dependent protease